MISLVMLLRGFGVSLTDWKVHLATGANPSPLEAFIRGGFEKWQSGQTKKNFECQMIVSLIQLDRDRWLFAGVYRVLGVRPGRTMPYYYRTRPVAGVDDLAGRVVVRFRREFRASYLLGEKYADRLEVSELLPRRFNIEPFPGYNRVIVSHEHLKTIVESGDASWRSALSSVKGVYLIVDTRTGRGYVGSATGNSGLWQRWQDYAETGHGDNKQLKELLKKRGIRYARHFQYTILEIADFHATDNDVIQREQHWKNVLLSRPHGHNVN